ncbi:MAG: lysophospholipid acyltransferase family protein [Planctomycetaceae bacterium]
MRSILIVPLVLAWVVLCASVALLLWPLSRWTRFGDACARWMGRGVLFLGGVRRRVICGEQMRGGPRVIVANHASMLDICALFATLPPPFRFVSRPFYFFVPLLGWAMFVQGHLALDPLRPRKAAAAFARMADRLRRGISLALFPEGARSPDGAVHRYKRGPFLVAIENGVPILPVRLRGAYRALPRGTWRIRAGEITVECGEPIPTAGLSREEARELAARVEAWTQGEGGGEE